MPALICLLISIVYGTMQLISSEELGFFLYQTDHYSCTKVENVPVITHLAGKALEMIHIIFGPHHHLKGWNHLRTC